MERSNWSIVDYARIVQLLSFGLDPLKDINSEVVSHVDIKKNQVEMWDGWMDVPSDNLLWEDCEENSNLHTNVYGHPALCGEYMTIFIYGWVAQTKGYWVH